MRFCGWMGIVGAGLLLACDWLMLGSWTSARGFMENWLAIMASLPRWRVIVGAAAGPLLTWFFVVGFWQVYLALRPAGRWLAFVCWAGLSIGFIYAGAAFHSSFPFMGYAAESMDAAAVINSREFEYFMVLFLVGGFPFMIGCVILAHAVLALPTRYPRWAILFNPLVLYAATYFFRFAPAPLGGLLYVGYGNIMFLTFFAASTATLWNAAPHKEDARE